MNNYPNLVTQAEMRYRADRIFEDWAPSRRRQQRRRLERLAEDRLRRTVA